MDTRQRWFLGLVVVALVETVAAAPAPSSEKPSAEQSQSRYSEWGENPFIIDRHGGQSSVEAAPVGPTLSGILWDPSNPCAVINGHLVGVGDHVEGCRVVEITKDEVVLSDGVTTKTLTVQ